MCWLSSHLWTPPFVHVFLVCFVWALTWCDILWESECYSCMYKVDVWWFAGGPSLHSCSCASLDVMLLSCVSLGVFLYTIFDGILPTQMVDSCFFHDFLCYSAITTIMVSLSCVFFFFFTVTRPRTLNVRSRKLTLSKACGTILDTTFDELCDRVSQLFLFLLFFLSSHTVQTFSEADFVVLSP